VRSVGPPRQAADVNLDLLEREPNRGTAKVRSAASSTRSRHLPVAVTEGNLITNLNEIGVRLWT
jgi:hypothetical protein